jgi:hypothetical protein
VFVTGFNTTLKTQLMNLPVYELRIDEANESFVEAIAIVDEPAIESNFLAFSKDQVNLTFAANDERMELLGAVMIPDMNIYRRDDDGKEYYVFFSADTIRQIAQVYFKKGFQSNLNLDHSATPAKSFVFQSYIVDTERGMSSLKGLNLPDGTWVVGVKVEDDAVWTDIKAYKLQGFSVEGIFQFFQIQKQKVDKETIQLLDELIEMVNNKM